MERREVARILLELKKNYRTFEVSNTTGAWWYEALRDFPPSVVFEAIKWWVMSQKWPPTISEIREACLPPGSRPIGPYEAMRSREGIPGEIWQDMERAYGPRRIWPTDSMEWRTREWIARYEERLRAGIQVRVETSLPARVPSRAPTRR